MVRKPESQGRLIPSLLIGGTAYWVYSQTGPALTGDMINTVPAFAAGVMAIAGIAALSDIAQALGGVLENTAAQQPKGHHGTAGWVKHRWQVWREHKWFGWHPYWGTLNGKPLFFDYESVAVSIGPPGSSKSTAVLSPMALCLARKGESLLIPDFKGSLSATLAKPMRKLGANVITVDLGNVFGGKADTAFYNVTSIIVDNLHVEGGLMVITDDAAEIALQLLPEKEEASGENLYFRIGARDLLEFCMLVTAVVYGEKGTLADTLEMLSNKDRLKKNALWVAGRLLVKTEDGKEIYADFPIEQTDWAKKHPEEHIRNFKQHLANLGNSIADMLTGQDTKGIGSFISTALQALRGFNITTHANKITSKNSFRFSQMKDELTTGFITVDASRINAQKDALGLLQFCALTELKRHPKKHVPVTLLADEVTNYQINDLASLSSWGRGYGIKLHLLYQFNSEFSRVYGDNALKTILSAAEIIQFLPGQSEPETLKLIEDMLGTRSVVTQNRNSDGVFGKTNARSYSEIGRPLMTMDEIRRCKQTILFVRQLKPMLVDLPQVFAIAPFRKEIDPDPFHGGKRYLQRVKLRLNGRGGPALWRALTWIFNKTLRRRRS